MSARRLPILIWIAAMTATALFVARLHVDTDMTAFLPRTATQAQQVLVDQFRDGLVSRLVLVAIEGLPPDRSSAASKTMAARLRTNSDIVAVENGEQSGFKHDQEFVWSHRYLISDEVDPSRFTSAGLRTALLQDLSDLGSMTGLLVKRILPNDPTRTILHLVDQLQGGSGGPARHDGAWVSPDGARALMLVRLAASGSDIDAEQAALTAIRGAFEAATATDAGARLVMTGPPVFAVDARDRIKSDATRLSVMASLIVAAALLLVYRSAWVLALSFVPVVSGALAGIAAVGLTFRTVHGITLGFGATLIGEAVDYAVYLFTQTTPNSPPDRTILRIWPTLRLGVLTSICGFSAMLLSSFNGFVQLGLFTITGLAVAVCVTRWVLPGLIPARFTGVRRSEALMRAAAFAARWRHLRRGVLLLSVISLVVIAAGNTPFWNGDLTSLSPVPAAEQQLDRGLRHDMRAPDAGYLIVIHAASEEAALEASERLTASLRPSIQTGALAGVDSPTQYLPSLAAQRTRQSALPDPPTLRRALDSALDGLPFQPGLFAPFIAAVDKARSSPLITRADLDGTSLSLKVDALLSHHQDRWVVTMPLRGVTSPDVIARAIVGEPNTVLVNLRAESAGLLGVYLREGVSLATLGAAAIVVLLAGSLRSIKRLATVMAPLAAAVIVTLAVLRMGGHPLSVFNLFGLLLVVAIGSNYCLFFDRQRNDPAGLPQVLASLLLANGCTVAGFAILALSQTPVLHDLGMPVAIGAFLSLVFATIIMSPVQHPAPPNAAAP